MAAEEEADDGTGQDLASALDESLRTGDAVGKATSGTLIAELALLDGLSAVQARDLRSAAGKYSAVVVVAPSSAWIAPLDRAARKLSRWDVVLAPTELRGNKREESASKVADALAEGRRVLGVSQAPERYLPECLVSTADLTVQIRPPSDRVICRVINLVTGRRIGRMPVGVSLGLDFTDLATAIRPGSSPAECARRLHRAKMSKTHVDPALERVPTLDRLHGFGEAMEWCRNLVAGIDAWRHGAPFPQASRVVFSGVPGTGKTTLVRSLARTAGLPLVATSVGSWFADSPGHLDSVIKEIARVWDTARAHGTAVVLIDEIDALPDRVSLDSRGRDWWTPVITYVLTCLDSAVSGMTRNLVICGTTNHGSMLDAALVRPGRLERVITVEVPQTSAEREAVLRGLLGEDLKGQDISIAAHASAGLSGAGLAAAVREARRRAVADHRPVASDDLLAGVAPPSNRSAEDTRRSAVHEAGHAVAALYLGFPVSTVSVVERPGSNGHIVYEAKSASSMPTRAEVEIWVVLVLSGAAAEEALLGSRSTGQGGGHDSDLGLATGTVAGLHASYGLGSTRSYRCSPEKATALLNADSTFRLAVEADLERLYADALGLMRARRRAVEKVAGALAAARILTGAQVQSVLRRRSVESDASKVTALRRPTGRDPTSEKRSRPRSAQTGSRLESRRSKPWNSDLAQTVPRRG